MTPGRRRPAVFGTYVLVVLLLASTKVVRVADQPLGTSGSLLRDPSAPLPASLGAAVRTASASGPLLAHTPPAPATNSPGFAVASTLVLDNNTIVPGNFRASGASGLTGAAFDRGKDVYYVAGSNTNTVAIVSATRDVVVGSVHVGVKPSAVAYDSRRGEIFVANDGSANVSVINDTSNTVVATVPVGEDPVGLSYAEGFGEVFVSVMYAGNVSVINDTTNTVVADIPVPACPWGSAYDPARAELFVAGTCGGRIWVVSALSNLVLTTIPQGGPYTSPFGVSFDAALGQVFVADDETGADGIVAVVSDASDSIVANVSIGVGTHPYSVAYDAAAGTVFVGCQGGMDVISDATDAIVSTLAASSAVNALAYDALDQQVVGATASGNLTFVNGTSDSVLASVAIGAAPQGLVVDSGTGQLFVAGASPNSVGIVPLGTGHVTGSVAAISDPLALAYDRGRGEVAVTSEAAETVTLVNDTRDAIVATLDTPGPDCMPGNSFWGCSGPTAVEYAAGTGQLIATADVICGNCAGPPMGEVLVVNDTNDTVVSTVSVGPTPDAVAYDAGRGELFVANRGTDNVSVVSAASDTVVATIPVGAAPTAEAYDPGEGLVFVANNGSDTVSAISDTNNTVVATVPVGSAPDALAYYAPTGSVLVADSGSGTVTVISDSALTPVEMVEVGSDPVALASAPAQGIVFVSNCQQGTISLLEPERSAVTFVESGLPIGKGWAVAFNESWTETTESSVTFTVPAGGPYPYLLRSEGAYRVSGIAPSGAITVGVSSVTEPVRFVHGATVALTFRASGLSASTNWCVTVGAPMCSATSVIRLTHLTPGNYTYSVGRIGSAGLLVKLHGAVVAPSGETDLLHGETFQVGFVYSVTFSEVGLANGQVWSVGIGGHTYSSSTKTLPVELENGTYRYRVAAVPGYARTPASGRLTVAGASIDVTVTFGPRS